MRTSSPSASYSVAGVREPGARLHDIVERLADVDDRRPAGRHGRRLRLRLSLTLLLARRHEPPALGGAERRDHQHVRRRRLRGAPGAGAGSGRRAGRAPMASRPARSGTAVALVAVSRSLPVRIAYLLGAIGTTGSGIWLMRLISWIHWPGWRIDLISPESFLLEPNSRRVGDLDAVGVVGQRERRRLVLVAHRRDDLVRSHRALERQQPADRDVRDRAGALVALDRDVVDLRDVDARAAGAERRACRLSRTRGRRPSGTGPRRTGTRSWRARGGRRGRPGCRGGRRRRSGRAGRPAPGSGAGPWTSAAPGRSSGSWRRGRRTGRRRRRGRRRSPRAASSRRGSAWGRSAARSCRPGGS